MKREKNKKIEFIFLYSVKTAEIMIYNKSERGYVLYVKRIISV